MKFIVIFDRLAQQEVEADNLQEAWKKAEDILMGSLDLDWTEIEIKSIEPEE